jgi:hypothetical protein
MFTRMATQTGHRSALSAACGNDGSRFSFAGCRVDGGVTKLTTLLVVGDQDVRRLNGAKISAKHQKARDLIAKVSEADLMLLLAY